MRIEFQENNDCLYAYESEEELTNIESVDVLNENVFRCKLFGLCLKKCDKYIKKQVIC